MNSLLIIEPHTSGHHAAYLRWIVEGALQRGYHLSVATYETSLNHPVIHSLIEKHHTGLNFVTLPDSLGRQAKGTGTISLIQQSIAYRKTFLL